MALDKAIRYGKEHRKRYYGAKAISRSCRNHGTCSYCLSNRIYQAKKENTRIYHQLMEYWDNKGEENV